MTSVIEFRVDGEPQPFPKKRTSRTGMIYSHDPGGLKRGWMDAVAHFGAQAMKAAGLLQPFGPGDPVTMWCKFYRTKPKSVKIAYPISKPDLDNYEYAISNALIGVCYHDDSRIVNLIVEKRWANGKRPGVEVRIERLNA